MAVLIDIDTVLTPRVLVIDDDPAIRRLLELHLTRISMRPIPATSSAEGLSLARRESPTAILLDVHLDGASGIDLCARLKADPETSAIPVLLLTGDAGIDSRLKGLKAGASEYITKPVNATELAMRLQGAIESHRRRLALESGSRPNPLRALGSINELDGKLASARNTTGAAAILNINRLRPINERHGHEVGDAVLQAWAQSLSMLAAQLGLKLAHGGNDNVVAVFPLKPPEVTSHSLARLAAAIDEVRLKKGAQPLEPLTCRHAFVSFAPDEAIPAAQPLLEQLQRALRTKTGPRRPR